MKRIASMMVACILGGCGGDSQVQLSADVNEFAADGARIVELRARVTFRGDDVADGKTVRFKANVPVLFKTREDAQPAVPGGRNEGDTEIRASTQGAVGYAYLVAPTSAQTVTITASYSTPNRDSLTDTLVINVTQPPLVSAGSGDGNIATTVSYFGFGCGAQNVGALVTDRDAIQLACAIDARNAAGETLHHVPVEFFTEAGRVEVTAATKTSPRKFSYVVDPVSLQQPVDVAPAAIELSAGLAVNEGVRTRNPRDGLVTLLAVVRGHEAFLDENANGVYDQGEPFVDEGEPFLDVDDDGVYQGNIDPLYCCDTNGNGRVDGPNGKWDTDVWIGRMTHVLWTGLLDPERSSIVPSTFSMPALSNQSFLATVVDENFNPLASAETRDEITVDALPSTRVGLTPSSLADGAHLENTHGMILDSQFPAFVFGLGGAQSQPIFRGFEQQNGAWVGREWNFVLTDIRSVTSTRLCETVAVTVEIEVEHTLAPDASGSNFSPRYGSLSTIGTLQAHPAPCPPGS